MAIHAEYKLHARTGWGVWYGEESAYNHADKLHGYVQTSYKAEARALLHVVRNAGVPTCIKCDCKPTTRIFNAILEDPNYDITKCADGELWQAINYHVHIAPKGFFKCDWIPIHLNDPEHPKYKRRGCYLANGITTEEHIIGNAGADRMADDGVALHIDNKQVRQKAKLRKYITRTVKHDGLNMA